MMPLFFSFQTRDDFDGRLHVSTRWRPLYSRLFHFSYHQRVIANVFFRTGRSLLDIAVQRGSTTVGRPDVVAQASSQHASQFRLKCARISLLLTLRSGSGSLDKCSTLRPANNPAIGLTEVADRDCPFFDLQNAPDSDMCSDATASSPDRR